jgi:hypothetical protein
MNYDRLYEFAAKSREQNALEKFNDGYGEAISVVVRYVPKLENIAYGERANILRRTFGQGMEELSRHRAVEFDMENNLSVSDQSLTCKLAVDGIMLLPIFFDEKDIDVVPAPRPDVSTPSTP